MPALFLLNNCADTPTKAISEEVRQNVANPQPTRVVQDYSSIPVGIDSVLLQSSMDFKAGFPGKAVASLKNAARVYPADKRPWLQMAQFSFDKGDYGDAVINGLEALQRDPTDKVANSIVAVSGLRLSTSILVELRQQNQLTGTVATEAHDLAKLLRESLGELVLVPTSPAKTPATEVVSHGGNAMAHKEVARKSPSVNISAPPVGLSPKANVDPFSSLQ